jgi:hypothetical protein
MAFVVPAEIGHAPYSAPVLEYLAAHFEVVHVIAYRDKLFPELSEDCWLLGLRRESLGVIALIFHDDPATAGLAKQVAGASQVGVPLGRQRPSVRQSLDFVGHSNAR